VAARYRAPELLLDRDTYDARVDMWSLGCVIAVRIGIVSDRF
jgi:serine/threonine protein kinase